MTHLSIRDLCTFKSKAALIPDNFSVILEKVNSSEVTDMNIMDTAIIGGADGPTAIYVTSSFNWAPVIAAALIAAGGIVAFLLWRKKKNKRA
jgi:Na+-transporting methylmalonyl-CoA/oxaloacetate decarboxylase beta subunit